MTEEEKKELERKTAEKILKKVYSFTLDDEIGMRYLLRMLAEDYGVKLGGV